MKIRIEYKITRGQIIWAAFQVYTSNKSRLTMQNVMQYLKQQIELFGRDQISLMGENWVNGEDEKIGIEEVKEWVNKKWQI